MSESPYTPEELAEFDKLSMQMSSRDQVTRIDGRVAMRRFIELHGKPKCDAMWAAIQAAEKAHRKGRG